MNTYLTRDEITLIEQTTERDVSLDESFPGAILFENIFLPEGWNKDKTNLLLLKDKNSWHCFIDEDLVHEESDVVRFVPYGISGWKKIDLSGDQDGNELVVILSKIVNELKFSFGRKELPDFKEENAESDIGIVKNIVVYEKERSFRFLYEYIGPDSIAAYEILALDNKLIKRIKVAEVSEGWIFESWDGRNGDGNEVPAGFYVLKIRFSQQIGEVYKCEIINKNW